MSTLTVPALIEEIIQRYDAKDEPFNEFAITGEMRAISTVLVEPSEAERAGIWAEYLAFDLSTGQHENPWNSYFGPMGSGINDQGQKVYFPDIAGTAPVTVDHWAERARSLNHPFLKARYADLAWEMSGPIGKRRRDVGDAQIAIDCYLDAIPRMADDHEHVQFAIRALDLAVLIGDKARADRARTELIGVHRLLMINKRGLWWYTIDRLLEDKKAGVTDAERAALVADLESIVTMGANVNDPTQFNPHEVQDASERLIRYYDRLGKFGDVKRLHRAVAESFEHFASNAEPILAAALLQTATDEYRNAGLTDERDRTRILMQQKIGAAGANLQSVEHKIEIPRDDIEKFLNLIVDDDDLATTFVRIAREFLLNRAQLEEQVKQTLKEAPLMAHIPATIMAGNHVAAKIGSVQDDPFGRLMHQTNFAFQFARPWLAQAFRRLSEKHEVVPEHFAGWANRHGLFEDMSLLVEGVRAWTRDDHVKAAHVIVPQVERALRKLASDLGLPITRPHPSVSETSVAIGMGEILYNEKVVAALGPDVALHLQALYSDPRGMNLRNEIAHGLMDAGQFYWHLGNLIVHSLLMLGLWKEFGLKPKPLGAATPRA